MYVLCSRVKQFEHRSRSSSMSMSRYHLPLMIASHPSHCTCTTSGEDVAMATTNKWDSCTRMHVEVYVEEGCVEGCVQEGCVEEGCVKGCGGGVWRRCMWRRGVEEGCGGGVCGGVCGGGVWRRGVEEGCGGGVWRGVEEGCGGGVWRGVEEGCGGVCGGVCGGRGVWRRGVWRRGAEEGCVEEGCGGGVWRGVWRRCGEEGVCGGGVCGGGVRRRGVWRRGVEEGCGGVCGGGVERGVWRRCMWSLHNTHLCVLLSLRQIQQLSEVPSSLLHIIELLPELHVQLVPLQHLSLLLKQLHGHTLLITGGLCRGRASVHQ